MTGGPIRRRVIAHGHVQGVFFRDSVRERAQAQGVSGWVRNRSDGAVEAVVEGPADAVDDLVAFLHAGPSRANVEEADVQAEAPEGLSGFEVR